MVNEICFVIRDILIFEDFDFSKFLKKKIWRSRGGRLNFFFRIFSFYQLKKYQKREVAKIWLISLKNVENIKKRKNPRQICPPLIQLGLRLFFSSKCKYSVTYQLTLEFDEKYKSWPKKIKFSHLRCICPQQYVF